MKPQINAIRGFLDSLVLALSVRYIATVRVRLIPINSRGCLLLVSILLVLFLPLPGFLILSTLVVSTIARSVGIAEIINIISILRALRITVQTVSSLSVLKAVIIFPGIPLCLLIRLLRVLYFQSLSMSVYPTLPISALLQVVVVVVLAVAVTILTITTITIIVAIISIAFELVLTANLGRILIQKLF